MALTELSFVDASRKRRRMVVAALVSA